MDRPIIFSGPKARPMHPDWARSIRDQCIKAGVPFIFKQWGEWAPWAGHPLEHPEFSGSLHSALFSDKQQMVKIGKKYAGRLLDSVEWNQFPALKP